MENQSIYVLCFIIALVSARPAEEKKDIDDLEAANSYGYQYYYPTSYYYGGYYPYSYGYGHLRGFGYPTYSYGYGFHGYPYWNK